MADFFDAAVQLTLKIKGASKGNDKLSLKFSSPDTCKSDAQLLSPITGTKLKDFVATMQSDVIFQSEIAKLRHGVEEYAKQFPTIGFEKETMRYKE